MKKFFKVIGILIAIAILVALGYLLVRKIKADTLAQRDLQIEANNIQTEAEFLCDRATKKLTTLIDEIETSLKVNIEVADIGGIEGNDIYFVTPVGANYMYITKTKVEDKDTFAIATDNAKDSKYIVSLKTLGLDECVYTNIKDYSIDKTGKITYNENK